jgi:SagB-type dehydrogenase family enzyme
VTAPAWDTLLEPPAEADHVWELYHENSKTGRHDDFPSQPYILERMLEMHESLPYDGYPAVELPAELPPLRLSLAEAIAARASCRSMRPAPLPLAALAALLQHAYGITRSNEGTPYPRPSRAVPSGGALYPLEVYLHAKSVAGLAPGVYHYNPHRRDVRRVRDGDASAELASALVAFQSHLAHQASAVFFLTALFERSTFKYGARGYRFVLLEAGHVAQNLNLVATALGLGCINLGGYHDRQVDDILGLDGLRHSTLYMIGVGEPAGGAETVSQ